MTASKLLRLVLFVAAVSLGSAFTATGRAFVTVAPQSMSSQPTASFWMLRMSSSDEGESDESAPTKTAPTSGTYYDDEVEPAPKEGISESMRARLIREASSGLDSNKSQTNVLLYVILGVAALVVIGGQGILY